MDTVIDYERARQVLRSKLPDDPEALFVLGSGLGSLVEELSASIRVPFEEVPGFPPTGVAGHRGEFVFGTLEGRSLLLQSGRYHLYEGHSPMVAAAPARIAAALGVRSLIVTNAAGSVRRTTPPGSLVLLADHLNLMGRSPLAGPVLSGEERFPDMSAPYDRGLAGSFLDAARKLGIPLHRGTYAAVLGPNYETPAEIRMLERMGADLVGMSTVPEVLAARSRNLRVVAVSTVTNWAAGVGSDPLNHEEVLEVGKRAASGLRRLVRAVVPELP